MKDVLNRVNESGKVYGMEISTEKTKSMLTSALQRQISFTLDGQPIEAVTSFKYLGSVIANDNDCRKDIRTRTAQALQ